LSTSGKRKNALPASVGRLLESAVDMWTRARLWLGRLLVWLRLPGVVVAQTYDAGIVRAKVTVHLGPLFSIVSVNGIDVYFHRLSGRIDGVGFSPARDYRSGETP
jgi:hypothetical protein